MNVPRKKKTDETAPVAAQVRDDERDGVATGEAEAETKVAQAVVFRLDEQRYALPIASVQEIQQIVEFTPVPGGSAALVGMIDLRGGVVPAIDVRALVGMPVRDYALDTPMIFLHAHHRLVALLVDAVEDVIDLPEGCMQPPSNLYALAERMLGICKVDAGLVVVLDPDRLVPDAALASVDLFVEEGAR